MNSRRLGSFVLGCVALLVLFAVNQWIFWELFDIAYWRWYLKNGAAIGLISAIVFKVWGDMLDKHTGLISSHPLDYLGACFQLIGLPIFVLGTQIKSFTTRLIGPDWLDYLLTIVWLPILIGSMFVWFVVVVPLQYLVYLVCGAPTRLTFMSVRQPIARLKGTRLEVEETRRGEVPEGWWDASISRKPIAVTNLLAALLLWIVSRVVG